MGHGSARIARAAGVREMTIRQLVRGDARTISPKLRDKITAVYDAWWDKRAPERTRAERGAATLARKRAIAGNWCAAAALDDDQLDTPGYRPRQGWKPATGTGTAPGIRSSGTTTRRRRHKITIRQHADTLGYWKKRPQQFAPKRNRRSGLGDKRKYILSRRISDLTRNFGEFPFQPLTCFHAPLLQLVVDHAQSQDLPKNVRISARAYAGKNRSSASSKE